MRILLVVIVCCCISVIFRNEVNGQSGDLNSFIYTGVSLGFHGSGDETVGTFYSGYSRILKNERIKVGIELGVSTMIHNPYKFFKGRINRDELATFLVKDNQELFYAPIGTLFDQFGGTWELPGKLDSRTDLEFSIKAGYILINGPKNKLILHGGINAYKSERYHPTILGARATLSDTFAVPDGTIISLTSFVFINFWDVGGILELEYQRTIGKSTYLGTRVNMRKYLAGDIILGYGSLHFGVNF